MNFQEFSIYICGICKTEHVIWMEAAECCSDVSEVVVYECGECGECGVQHEDSRTAEDCCEEEKQ